MTYAPIVISGPAGSGKSTLARMIAKSYDLFVMNAGDILLKRLASDHIRVSSRAEIGGRYLEHFSIEQYRDDLRRYINSDIVLEGIRISSAISTFKAEMDLVHVARPPAPSSPDLDDEFSGECRKMLAQADIIVPWRVTDSALLRDAKSVGVLAQQLHRS